MSNWQPARVVDFVLRFDTDIGPAIKMGVEAIKNATMPPEDQARETCRAVARGVGRATHAYVWAAPQMALTHVKIPVDVDPAGPMIHLRLHLGVPMQSPIDWTNGQAVAGLLQSLMALPRGSITRVEVGFPAAATMGENGPVLSMVNPRTLPGQKLCAYCRNPMPAYEVQCGSCGARAES